MSPIRISYPVSIEATPESNADAVSAPLAEVLRPLVDDRSSSSEEMVVKASARVQAWVLHMTDGWSWEEAGTDLEAGLAAWHGSQGWRGPCSTWLDSVRRTWHDGRAASMVRAAIRPRDVLCEELALWVRLDDSALAHADESAGQWNGEPRSVGRRIPSRPALAAHHVADAVERGRVGAEQFGRRGHGLALDTVIRLSLPG